MLETRPCVQRFVIRSDQRSSGCIAKARSRTSGQVARASGGWRLSMTGKYERRDMSSVLRYHQWGRRTEIMRIRFAFNPEKAVEVLVWIARQWPDISFYYMVK